MKLNQLPKAICVKWRKDVRSLHGLFDIRVSAVSWPPFWRNFCACVFGFNFTLRVCSHFNSLPWSSGEKLRVTKKRTCSYKPYMMSPDDSVAIRRYENSMSTLPLSFTAAWTHRGSRAPCNASRHLLQSTGMHLKCYSYIHKMLHLILISVAQENELRAIWNSNVWKVSCDLHINCEWSPRTNSKRNKHEDRTPVDSLPLSSRVPFAIF